jgi:hypothetical protein
MTDSPSEVSAQHAELKIKNLATKSTKTQTPFYIFVFFVAILQATYMSGFEFFPTAAPARSLPVK